MDPTHLVHLVLKDCVELILDPLIPPDAKTILIQFFFAVRLWELVSQFWLVFRKILASCVRLDRCHRRRFYRPTTLGRSDGVTSRALFGDGGVLSDLHRGFRPAKRVANQASEETRTVAVGRGGRTFVPSVNREFEDPVNSGSPRPLPVILLPDASYGALGTVLQQNQHGTDRYHCNTTTAS